MFSKTEVKRVLHLKYLLSVSHTEPGTGTGTSVLVSAQNPEPPVCGQHSAYFLKKWINLPY